MRKVDRYLVCGVAAIVGFSFCVRAFANPSHKDVEAGLQVYGGEDSKKVNDIAEDLYRTASALMKEFGPAMEGNKVGNIAATKLRNCNFSYMKLKQAAEQLRILREPAAVDWQLRADHEHELFNRVMDAYRPTPQGSKVIQQCKLQVAKLAKDRDKELKQLEQLVAKQQFERAENEWYKYYYDHHQYTMFLTPTEIREFFKLFDDVSGRIQIAMRSIREKKALENLTKARQEQTPNFKAVLDSMASAAQTIGTAGKVEFDGKAMNGPALITFYGEKWKELHVMTLRCRGLDWALNQMGRGIGDMSRPGPTSDSEPIVTEYDQFSKAMLPALAAIVKADAVRVSDAEAPTLHAEYLKAIAPVASRTSNYQLVGAITPALDALVAKSMGLAQNVAAYKTSTDELLRWRGKSAFAAAKAKAEKVMAIEGQFAVGLKSDKASNFVGLLPDENNNMGWDTPTYMASAPEILPTALKRLMNQDAIVNEVFGQSPGKPGLGRYRSRCWVTTRLGDAAAPAIAALKSDLYVTENAGPLSLNAALAVDTAERGDFAVVGGKITGMYLEGLITRFAAIPPTAAALVPLGSIPAEPTRTDKLNQAVMRFDVTATWGQHPYFFVELPPQQVASSR